jgi:hypothetical protein
VVYATSLAVVAKNVLFEIGYALVCLDLPIIPGICCILTAVLK